MLRSNKLKVGLTSVVHPGHLRRLPSDQGATRLQATLGDPGNDIGSDGHVELGAREIVQKIERFGSLDDEVVDRHGDEVDACRSLV